MRLFFEKKPKKGPPSIFWCFATEWMLKNPNGSPFKNITFQFFGIVRLVFRIFFFSPKRPPRFFDVLQQWMLKNAKWSPGANSVQLFGFFRYCWRKYFDTLKSFRYFWALDMAPTWAGLFLCRLFRVFWIVSKTPLVTLLCYFPPIFHIWERKIFKSNGFFYTKFAENLFMFNFKGVTHRFQLT